MACLDLLEQAVVEEHPETVAAVIAEPVMLSAGVHIPHPEYFPRLRELCDNHNVLLIYDEIITGFGRTGRLFGAERVMPRCLQSSLPTVSARLSGESQMQECSSGRVTPSAAIRSPARSARPRCATSLTTT